MPDATAIQERFKQLPKVVQDAITSTDVEKHMRVLADKQKLHVDQWQALENEVMLALLGFKRAEELEKNLTKSVNIGVETARQLALQINEIVFEPIRQELERQLEHPEAKKAQVTDVEAARSQVLEEENAPKAPAPTPPAPKPETTAERPPAPENYQPGTTSAERKAVHDDPYREPPV